MDTKPRILCLLKILIKYTDQKNPLTTNEIISLLESEYGLNVHRITLKKDIEALQSVGYDVIEIKSSQNKYFLGDRLFELPELKLLIDAIESSKFITQSKSEMLIDKIYQLASVNQVKKLERKNYIVKKVKPNNEQIYYIVDTINEAINEGKQISFQYYDYTGLKKKVLKNKGEVYTISPYHVVWDGDYYYVVGYSDKHTKVISFRVDRIATTPEILDDCNYPQPEDYDLNRFSKTTFRMFDGEIKQVDLRCDNSIMRVIIDKFGEDVTTLAYDMESFRVLTEVAISPTFFGWVFGFKCKIEILGPSEVKEEFKDMIIQFNKKIS